MATGKTGQEAKVTIGGKDKTKAAFQSAQKNLKKTSAEADRLSKRFRNVARATMAIEGPLGGTAGRLSAVATMIQSVSLAQIGMGVAFAGSTALVIKSLKTFGEYEEQTFKINQLLEQTGGAAGLAGFEIERMARRIGKETLASAADVREASAILLTFKSVGVDAFERTMQTAADMGSVTGQDLKQNLIQLGKALEDPATGLSALRRSGISFTDSTRDMIVKMNEMGDVAGAQAATLAMLEGQLGGTGAAAAGGLKGAIDSAVESWDLMLVRFAESSTAGDIATKMASNLAGNLEYLSLLMADDRDSDAERWKIKKEIVALEADAAAQAGRFWNQSERRQKEIASRAQKLIQAKLDELSLISEKENKERDAAREKGEATQIELVNQKKIEAAKKAQIKLDKESEKIREKEQAAALKYGDRLDKEVQKLQDNLLTKSLLEEEHLQRKLEKINESLISEAISQAEADEQALNAFRIFGLRKSEIKKENDAADIESENEKNKLIKESKKKAMDDAISLMGSQSKKIFKIGQAVAIVDTIMNAHKSAQLALATIPPPWGFAAAAANYAAGVVRVQKIKSQAPPHRRFGGSVIAGRSYKVGEAGEEIFRPTSSGSIINNNTANSFGGASNNINVTVVNETGDDSIKRNMNTIWSGIIGRMNEEGVSFA